MEESSTNVHVKHILNQLAGLKGEIQALGTFPTPRDEPQFATMRERLQGARAMTKNVSDGPEKVTVVAFADAVERCLVCFETQPAHGSRAVIQAALDNAKEIHARDVVPLLRG